MARDLRAGELDVQTANALTNCYRVVLHALIGGEAVEDLVSLRAQVDRAAEIARRGAA